MYHLYSKGCEYAIQALMSISERECRSGFSARSVCRRAGLPEAFTRKIFQTLMKNHVLVSKRGPGGGYRFNKNPHKISLLSIVHAIDGKNAFDKCVVRDFKCKPVKHCSLHPMWVEVKTRLIKELEKSTVAELLEPNEPKPKERNDE